MFPPSIFSKIFWTSQIIILSLLEGIFKQKSAQGIFINLERGQ